MTAGDVVVASPVRQSPGVLREFLSGWERELWLYDDNDLPESREMLRISGHRILPRVPGLPLAPYLRYPATHLWTREGYQRVGQIKDAIIRHFLESDTEWLFLIDSDLLVDGRLVEHLVGLDLPIVSEVFWTKWRDDVPVLPQVWDWHAGQFRSKESILRFRIPGQYEVGGLGACTLIHRDPLAAGVRFEPVKGLNYEGEDRQFCVRASVLGFPLVVDTHYPAYHMYRHDDLAGVAEWRERGRAYFDDRLDVLWEQDLDRWFKRCGEYQTKIQAIKG